MGIKAATGRPVEGNSRVAAAATHGKTALTEPTERRWTTSVVALATTLALLTTAGCGGAPAETDPLASIAEAVRAEDRAPAPLAEVWRRTPDAALSLQPAVGEQSVYLALGNRLHAWSTLDGTPRFAPIELESEISAPPATAEQQVVVATRGDGDIPPRLWRFGADGAPLSQTPLQSPIREIGTAPGTLVYVDETGVGRLGGGDWHTSLEQARTVTLAAASNVALVTTADGVLAALDVASGAVRWQHHSDDPITRAVAADDRVYFGAGIQGVVALRARDGGVAWRRPLGTPVVGAPALTEDLLWVAAFDAKLHAFKASNGTEMEGYLTALSSRGYLDLASYDPWVVVGPAYGPWVAVRGPTRAELAVRAQQRPEQVTVRQPAGEGNPDLAVPAGSGPAGVAVVNADGTVVFLQPQRAR
ncbi:MAG: PQQ-binding-like beta-propeller repeat protein [Acidobacteriota bacterium]